MTADKKFGLRKQWHRIRSCHPTHNVPRIHVHLLLSLQRRCITETNAAGRRKCSTACCDVLSTTPPGHHRGKEEKFPELRGLLIFALQMEQNGFSIARKMPGGGPPTAECLQLAARQLICFNLFTCTPQHGLIFVFYTQTHSSPMITPGLT